MNLREYRVPIFVSIGVVLFASFIAAMVIFVGSAPRVKRVAPNAFEARSERHIDEAASRCPYPGVARIDDLIVVCKKAVP